MKFIAIFKCIDCGQEVGTTVKNGAVYHEYHHDCVGEEFGYVGDIDSVGTTASNVELVLEERDTAAHQSRNPEYLR